MLTRVTSLEGSSGTANVGPIAHHPSLLELLHENTKYTRANQVAHALAISRELTSARAIEALSHNFKVFRFARQIELPPCHARPVPLPAALRARVSTRSFAASALPLAQLAEVLVPAAGCNRTAAVPSLPHARLRFRCYPSAGGAYPIELYPILLRIAGRLPCVTHYDPRGHRLSVLRELSAEALSAALIRAEGVVDAAAALLVLTAVFRRATPKYGDRAYRLALLEAGHLAQNLCLTAAAAGVGSLAWGGYYDDELHRLLGVDGLDEAVVHTVFIGNPLAGIAAGVA